MENKLYNLKYNLIKKVYYKYYLSKYKNCYDYKYGVLELNKIIGIIRKYNLNLSLSYIEVLNIFIDNNIDIEKYFNFFENKNIFDILNIIKNK